MELDRIVVVALVNRGGAVLLRSRDERSAVRANRWSLPGGGAEPKESPQEAAVRMVREQSGLTIQPELKLVWWGRLSDPVAEVYFYATSTTATSADIPTDPALGAIPRFGGYVVDFIPASEVLSGRTFTPVSGYVLPDFMSSRLYRELAASAAPHGLA